MIPNCSSRDFCFSSLCRLTSSDWPSALSNFWNLSAVRLCGFEPEELEDPWRPASADCWLDELPRAPFDWVGVRDPAAVAVRVALEDPSSPLRDPGFVATADWLSRPKRWATEVGIEPNEGGEDDGSSSLITVIAGEREAGGLADEASASVPDEVLG